MSRRSWTKHLAGNEQPKRAQRSARGLASPAIKQRPRARREPQVVEVVDCDEIQIHDILIVGKPRQTQRDKWKKRECVLRYRAMCDEMRLRGVKVPDSYVAVVYLPMPKSWTPAKRFEMNGTKHQTKPDHDNCAKSIGDSVRRQDQRIHDGRAIKRWAYRPRLVIVNTEKRDQPSQDEIAFWLPVGEDPA